MNDYSNLPKVSDFDSLMNQLYKTNYSSYDSRMTQSSTYHMYHLETCPLDPDNELYLPGYNIDDDYE
jgi:hypothetical protein